MARKITFVVFSYTMVCDLLYLVAEFKTINR